MRSSDPIEGPVFLGLKRIIIIISKPGSGHELYYEHRRKSLFVSAPREISKTASEVTNGAPFEKIGTAPVPPQPKSLFYFFLVFDFVLEFYVVCMSSAFEVER